MKNDLISRSALKSYIDCGHLRPPTEKCFSELDVVRMLDKLPTIDAVEVVRCEYCKEAVECQLYGEHCGLPSEKGIFCEVWQTVVDKNGYCYQGTKMDGGTSDGN